MFFQPQVAGGEVTRDEPTPSYVSGVSRLLLVLDPIAGQFVGPLDQQPSLKAVDEQVRPGPKPDPEVLFVV